MRKIEPLDPVFTEREISMRLGRVEYADDAAPKKRRFAPWSRRKVKV